MFAAAISQTTRGFRPPDANPKESALLLERIGKTGQTVDSAKQKAAKAFASAGAITQSISFKKVVDDKFNSDVPNPPAKL